MNSLVDARWLQVPSCQLFVAGLLTLKTPNPSPDDQLAKEVVTEAKKTEAADEEKSNNEESKEGEDAA